LKPLVPALAQTENVALVSVIVTTVLLNVAFTWTNANVTLRRTLRRFARRCCGGGGAAAGCWLACEFTAKQTPVKNKIETSKHAVCLLHVRLLPSPATSSLLFHILDALFAGNRLLRPLTGSSVGAGALTANRQTATMANAAVATDILQTRNILRQLAAELTSTT
jgi:hypothetical protein